MTNLAIIVRCSIVVMAFAAFGFIGSGPPFDRDSLTSVVYSGSLGLSIAVCLAGGLLLLRRLRSGLIRTPLALVYMFCCSVVAAFGPPFLVVASGYNSNDEIPAALVLAMATFGIGVISFLIFGAASSLDPKP